MRALTVSPGHAGSARLESRDEPSVAADQLEVETLLVGVCGTDVEIVAGTYGTPPPGRDRLVLGHEAVGRIRDARDASGFAVGNLVVPIVRRPDPEPCGACAVGEWDMCENGQYTEHGIKAVDGFARDRFALEERFAVRIPASLGELAVLVEPTSIVAKAWEQIERIGARAHWAPRTVLVTGAGPVGLLAALLARQRGLTTHVLDRVTDGPKPALVADVGAEYHTGPLRDACPSPDIVVECTGVGSLVLDAIAHTTPGGIVCLAGISSGTHAVELDAAALNRRIVLENSVVFGTVNANRRHYEAAVTALEAAERSWLQSLISRRVPIDSWPDAFDKKSSDVKVVLAVAT
jgi:threonine dehydrogenase-like Zn-dependent dehydrogenase